MVPVHPWLQSIASWHSLDDESFHTILCEIEAILNSRHITKLSDYCNDWRHLDQITSYYWNPSHYFLLDSSKKTTCALSKDGSKFSTSLTFFGKGGLGNIWHFSKKDSINDVVIITDPSASRCFWLMGKVTKTVSDRKVQSAQFN